MPDNLTDKSFTNDIPQTHLMLSLPHNLNNLASWSVDGHLWQIFESSNIKQYGAKKTSYCWSVVGHLWRIYEALDIKQWGQENIILLVYGRSFMKADMMAYRPQNIIMLLTFIYCLDDQPQTSFNNQSNEISRVRWLCEAQKNLQCSSLKCITTDVAAYWHQNITINHHINKSSHTQGNTWYNLHMIKHG